MSEQLPVQSPAPTSPLRRLRRLGSSRRRAAPRASGGSRWGRLLSLVREPELAVWAVFIVLTPFYVFKSGRPQPADFLTLALLPLILRRGRTKLSPPLRATVTALFCFAGYVAVVNVLWGLLLIDYDVKKVGALGFAGFYLFNAYVFTMGLLIYVRHGSRFIATTTWAMVAAVLLQVALFVLVGGGGFREKLFFNNPNQLGYFSLVAASIIAFGQYYARVPTLLAGAALAAATLLAASSLSKGAILGSVLVAGVAALRKPVLLVAAVGVIAVGFVLQDPSALVEKVSYRLADLGGQSDDTLAGRGYSRIEMHPEYLVLGAGEVGHDRHGDYGGELHSSFATVLFSYGIVGVVLLVSFLWRALRRVQLLDLLFLAPIFFYGLTHQGMRARLFWVFLALLCVVGHHVRSTAATRTARARGARAPARATPPPTGGGAPTGSSAPTGGSAPTLGHAEAFARAPLSLVPLAPTTGEPK